MVKRILDACCGSRMFWYQKECDDVVYMDNRKEEHTLCDGRRLAIKPDMVGDFRAMPFADASFDLVVFDPPHLLNLGEKSWMAKKYGRLERGSWRDDLSKGFAECWRVLRVGGFLVFKWSEGDIRVSEVLKLSFWWKPLFGSKGGKTVWLVFTKRGDEPCE